MVILVVIVIGAFILVVLLKARRRKLVINKLQKATTEKENIEMKLKNKMTVIEASSSNQPPYAEIQTVAPPNVASKSEDLVNLNSPLTVGYSEIELEPDDRKQALPAKPPRHVTSSDQIPKATGPQPYVPEHEPTP